MSTGRRRRCVVVGAVVACVSNVAFSTSAMSAAPDSTTCDTPTSTRSGGGQQAVVVHAGDVLLLTDGTFTGPLSQFADGGTLCVAASATLDPKSMKNPAGDLIVIGHADLPTFTSASGFDMLVSGTTTVGNVTLKDSSSVTVAASGSVTTGSFLADAGSLIDNAGTIDTRLVTNAGSTIRNSGQFTSRSGLAIEGSLQNTGHVTVIGGALRFDVGSTMNNLCVIDASDDVTVNSDSGIMNAGIIRAVDGVLRLGQGGVFTQAPVGISVTDTLNSEGTIVGFGRYRFGRTTHTELAFVGASDAEPIVVQDLTPPVPPQIFDQQSGTVANAVAGIVPDPPADATVGTCAGAAPPTPVADVLIAKTGPATVVAGGQLTYTITVSNAGPDTAVGVGVTDSLPTELTDVSASAGGTVAPGTVTWTLPTLPAGGAPTIFTVTGTAPASGHLTDRVVATSTSSDPDPSNNDGRTRRQSVTTAVVAAPPPPNNPPTAQDVVVGTRATEPVAGAVPFDDPDDGQAVTAALGTPPHSGAVIVDADGVFTYLPFGTFTGVDTFTVIGCDNGTPQLCAQSTVNVVVAPLAVNDAASTTRDTPVSIPVLLNDIGDVVGGPSVDHPPRHGSVAAVGNVLVYTPTSGFTGIDSFTYRICSAPAPVACGTASVGVLVSPPSNRSPTAEDTAVHGPTDATVSGRVRVSDPDVGQTLTVTLLDPPASGTAVVNTDGTFTFRPPANLAGVFTFNVQVCDDFAPPACDGATITATITPVATPDAVVTTVNTPVTFNVTANDRGGVANPTAIGPGPSSGVATIGVDGQITYTPNDGFVGVDKLIYAVCATTQPTLCTKGVVTITVGTAPNGPPTLDDLSLETDANRPVEADLSFTDPDPAQTVNFSVVADPASGVATVDAAGRVQYVPADAFTGRDSFDVEVCDNAAPTPACDTATVSVTVMPIAEDDTAVVDANTSVIISVEDNDVGNVGPMTILSQPANGDAEIVDSVLYTPASGFVGADSFAYQVCSNTPGDEDVCATARVDVSVLPVAADDAASTVAGQPVTVDLLSNDTTGIDATVTVVTGPADGTAIVGAGGTVVYAPTGDFTGHDDFLYQVCTSGQPQLCTQARVSVEVSPNLKNNLAVTPQATAVSIDVAVNDFGNAGQAVVVVPPAHGTVSGGGLAALLGILGVGDQSGSEPLVYTPLPGFTGVDSFHYERCAIDDTSLCTEAVVVVTVRPAQPPPQPTPPTTTEPTTPLPPTPPTQATPPPTTEPTTPLPPTTPSTGALPRTGATIASLLGPAAGLMLFGALAGAATRRRR